MIEFGVTIVVTEMQGDAQVRVFDKKGNHVHTEQFYGKTSSGYIRKIPVSVDDYGHSEAIHSGPFEYCVGFIPND